MTMIKWLVFSSNFVLIVFVVWWIGKGSCYPGKMGEYAPRPASKGAHTPKTAKPKKLITFDRISPTSEMLLDQLDLPDFDGLLRYLLQLVPYLEPSSRWLGLTSNTNVHFAHLRAHKKESCVCHGIKRAFILWVAINQ